MKLKFKYKGIIVGVTMATMCVGLLTFQLGKPNNEGKNREKKVVVSSTIPSATPLVEKPIEDDGTKLLLNAYPEINVLVENYLDATSKADIEAVKKLISTTNSINEEKLRKENENIEGYKNIDCYTLKGKEEGTFVVYVYEELKIVNIDTLAPGLIRIYVCTRDDGSYYINFGQIDEDVKKFIEDTSTNSEVVNLIKTVDTKIVSAKTSDIALKTFIDNIEEISKKAKDEKVVAKEKAEEKKKEESKKKSDKKKKADAKKKADTKKKTDTQKKDK